MQNFAKALQNLCTFNNSTNLRNNINNSIPNSSATCIDVDEEEEDTASESSGEEDFSSYSNLSDVGSKEDLSIHTNLSDNNLPSVGNNLPTIANASRTLSGKKFIFFWLKIFYYNLYLNSTLLNFLATYTNEDYFIILGAEALKKAAEMDIESVCSICLCELFENAASEGFDKNIKIVELNMCKHMFHKECIEVRRGKLFKFLFFSRLLK